MSEVQEAAYLSAEERLEALKDVRTALQTVGERLYNPLQALDALKVARAKLQPLMDDARAGMEESK